jgi:opacity protein-like surface antigen
MRRLNSLAAIACVIAALTAPAALDAQDSARTPVPSEGPHGFLFKRPLVSLGVRGGFDLARTQGALYDSLLIKELTLNRSDFNTFSIAGDLGVRVSSPLDLVLGAGFTRTSKPSEFRDYVDQNNLPITQQTTLSTVPLTVALRWYLTSTGRQIGRFVWIPARVTPYVGAGGGMIHYSLTQTGSFVDFQDLSIFDATLQSSGWAPVGLVMAGVDYSLGTRVFVNADVRYLLAKGTLHQDFVQFTDGIDLSGAQFSLGLHVRL